MKTSTILLVTFVLLFQVSCKKSESDSQTNTVTGAWLTTYNVGTTATGSTENINDFYLFKADGTFEYKMFYTYGSSTQPAGYISKKTGNYEVKGNTVVFTNIVYYERTDSNQKNATESSLVVSRQLTIFTETWNYNFVNSSEMTFSVQCPPNALCIGPRTFKKLQGITNY